MTKEKYLARVHQCAQSWEGCLRRISPPGEYRPMSFLSISFSFSSLQTPTPLQIYTMLRKGPHLLRYLLLSVVAIVAWGRVSQCASVNGRDSGSGSGARSGPKARDRGTELGKRTSEWSDTQANPIAIYPELNWDFDFCRIERPRSELCTQRPSQKDYSY